MSVEYSVDVCRKMGERFRAAELHRPQRVERYDPGTELTYEITGVLPARRAVVRLVVEKFVGGGFAGQVYRVKVLEVDAPEGAMAGIEAGSVLAMKILVPPSGFSRLFRNVIFGIGFQGPFQLQVNPAAARAGALWQKFIRRAAGLRFGDERSVVDIHATFVDENLGSCGELSEWIDGRTWLLEVDDRLDLLRRWRRGKPVDEKELGSPEYRAKYEFMTRFIELLHEMGAVEFGRQYEWSTCKSQPNCLKRLESENDPAGGIVAVDFRAGLALLAFLPMSPGDVMLVLRGLARGSLVQFDRGDLDKLARFLDAHPEEFADMRDAYDQLAEAERIYRDSLPDVTHNHVRLLYSGNLWSTILGSAVTGWRVRNIADEASAAKLRRSRIGTLVFLLLGLIPVLGKLVRRLWARGDYRRHYGAMLTSWNYLRRGVRGRVAEWVTVWHRAGRLSAARAMILGNRPGRSLFHLPLSILPVGLHRFLTDGQYAREKLDFIFIRPLRLYFNAEVREQWLRDMVTEGRQKRLVSKEDAETILGQLHEPYIQKYLKSLAVHVCTVPVTQIVSVIVAWVYVRLHPEMSPAQSAAAVAAILVLFQITPISPGSMARGLYVVYVMIRDRSFSDYNIAAFLSFFKYVGYLAFPIQMAYAYPVMARFMAAHWATGAVSIVPVFGESGALLEHGVFSATYNLPLTLRRRMTLRETMRLSRPSRSWHVVPTIIGGAAAFALIDYFYLRTGGVLPALKQVWWAMLAIPLLAGSVVTLAAAGTALPRRIIQAALTGSGIGLLSAVARAALEAQFGIVTGSQQFIVLLLWKVFVCTIFSSVAAMLTELLLSEPTPSRSYPGSPTTGASGQATP
ncbi:MAG: hypothetical protein JSV80_04185 [Acidobacteriota bacterium]|nr:MAG: hypothetical protein JSV80_04185 [Acidobacteriota bacterium]